MSKSSIIHLRNLIVFFLIAIIATAGAEAVFSRNKQVTSDKVPPHNGKTIYLQMEATPLDDVLLSKTNAHNLAKKINISSVLRNPDNYPLVNHLSEKTQIDDALNIVVIGDSFVWGANSLNRNELFWRVLENKLRKEGVRANVFGVAATGANAYEELEWLCSSSLVNELNPDLVIFGYVYNDAEYSDITISTETDFEQIFVPEFFSERFPNLSSLIVSKIAINNMYSNKYSSNEYVALDGAPPILKGRFYEKYKTDFCKKLDDYAKNADFPVCIMTLPPLPNSDMVEELFKPLKNLYKSYKNVIYYNCVNEFNRFASKEHSKNYSVNSEDFHPGSATNKFYADYIMDFIRKDFPHLLKNNTGFEAKKEIIINEWLPYDISLKSTSKNSYTFRYPSADEKHTIHGIEFDDSYFLTYPLGKEHIRLNFADSINISGINAQGEYKNLQLYYTCINKELGYDDHSIYEFTTDGGDAFSVSPDIEITSVLVSAEFDAEANRNITLSFVENGGEK